MDHLAEGDEDQEDEYVGNEKSHEKLNANWKSERLKGSTSMLLGRLEKWY